MFIIIYQNFQITQGGTIKHPLSWKGTFDLKQDNSDKNPQHNNGEFEMLNNYGDEPDGEFDQDFKHAPNGEPYQYQNHDWHHNVQDQHLHAPYLMHAAHDDCKFIK